jgi:hypothetical protein
MERSAIRDRDANPTVPDFASLHPGYASFRMGCDNASQLARTPGAVRDKGLFSMGIKLAGAGVPLNGRVELLCVEGLEPRTKPRELARGKLFYGFFDVFGGSHVRNIAFAREA